MILDYVDKIGLPDDMKHTSFNELQTLDSLWKGMCFVYDLAVEIEHKANQKIKDRAFLQNMPSKARKAIEGKEIKYISYGRAPTFEGLDKGLLYSFFQWYAISACNYIRLVGYLVQQVNPNSQTINDYIQKVIPEVKWFRDKIAAHPVRASKDNDKRDNEAERRASVLYQIGFENGRFMAPVWKVHCIMEGEQITSRNPDPWSITETHEKLVRRYKKNFNKGSMMNVIDGLFDRMDGWGSVHLTV